MQYFDEMQDKYGFDDGGAVPPDAEARRLVYCRVMNKFLKQHNSGCRILPYNRPGCHNPIMIVTVKASYFDSLTAAQQTDPEFDWDMAQMCGKDEGWEQALQDATELEPDQFVKSVSSIDHQKLKAALDA